MIGGGSALVIRSAIANPGWPNCTRAESFNAALVLMVPKVMTWATLSSPTSRWHSAPSHRGDGRRSRYRYRASTRARVEEPLEQQPVRQRVDVGDPQRPGDDRTGRRTAARSDADADLVGVGDEVADDEEVGRETHLDDDVELAVGAIEVFLRDLGPGNRRVASRS